MPLLHLPYDWGEVLALANIILGAGIAALNIMLLKKSRKVFILRVAIAAAGIYWSLLYVIVYLFEPNHVDPVMFGEVFVRPAFTFTLALWLACALYRWFSNDAG